ncbi:MAG: nucleotide exchange factor GrpE [Pyrinomonadaceae bacterium]
MNHKEQIPKPEESFGELDIESTGSVDDFIKELEAKEKDLHITADLTIEVEESEFDPRNIRNGIPADRNGAAQTSARPSGIHSAGAKTRIYELENEVESLTQRLSSLREERNEVQEKSDRRLKDFESYKYRMDRERRGAFIDQISNLASQMLPVLDNLDRALNSVAGLDGKRSDEFQQFYDGIGLVNQQVNETFADMGVQPIATVGETFDPNFHEAVAAEERTDMEPNTIIGEMLRGYRIGNRVIRHSMVKVTTGPPPVKKDLVEEPLLSLNKAETNDAPDSIPEPLELLPDPTDFPDLEALFPEAD